MMSVFEYAQDVNKTSKDILTLCKSLGINAINDTDMLSEDDIVLLDNSITEEDQEENIEKEIALLEQAESMVLDIEEDLEEEVKKSPKKVSKPKENNDNFKQAKKNVYKNKQKLEKVTQELDNIILYKEGMNVSSLAKELKINPLDLIKKLMGLGIMANINQSLDFDTTEILVLDYDKTLKKEETQDIVDFENLEIIEKEEELITRPAVVTIMGHVDHGKTSLLDSIRKTHVVDKEAGGITQHIGAYQVEYKNQKITFIDTPGHEAFTEMRARGASVTDIVVIIVAADDGVKPQTIEAIDHAKAANVPIIVAINKMDKPNINPDRVLQELTNHGITPEEWGGDTLVNRISAKTMMGVDELLDNILLVAELKELKANPNRYALGTVIEARLDKNVGAISTLLIQNGTLRLGDIIVVGNSYGKVRTLKDDTGKNIVSATPSTPVEVTGLKTLPVAGDHFMAFETEKEARYVAEQRTIRSKEEDKNRKGMSLDDLFGAIKEGKKEINVLLKADVKGSEEAVKNSLSKIKVEDVRINVIRSGVGVITESDIALAKASNAIIIGFNIRPNSQILENAKNEGIDVRLHTIIYKVIEELEQAMQGMLDPEYEERVIGQAEVRQIFKFSKVGNIAGSHVTSGIIKKDANARVIRDGIIIYDGKIGSLQKEKDRVSEVKQGFDCGITIDNFQDIKENDVIEAYEFVEVKR